MPITSIPTFATGDTIEAEWANTLRDNGLVLDARTGGDPPVAGRALVSLGPLAGGWGQVPTSGLADGAVDGTKIAAGVILSSHIQDGAITADDLANGAVTATKIATGVVLSSHIQDGAITANDLAPDSVTTIKLANGAVDGTKIAAGVVLSSHIQDGAIAASDLADGSVITNRIAAGAVDGSRIADGAVTATKIAAGAVLSSHIQDGAITANDLADGSVITNKIADGAITGDKIVSGVISSSHIVNGTIVLTDLSAATVDQAVGTGSLRTLGTGPLQAAAGPHTHPLMARVTTGSYIGDGAATRGITVAFPPALVIIRHTADDTRHIIDGTGAVIIFQGAGGAGSSNDAVSPTGFTVHLQAGSNSLGTPPITYTWVAIG